MPCLDLRTDTRHGGTHCPAGVGGSLPRVPGEKELFRLYQKVSKAALAITWDGGNDHRWDSGLLKDLRSSCQGG